MLRRVRLGGKTIWSGHFGPHSKKEKNWDGGVSSTERRVTIGGEQWSGEKWGTLNVAREKKFIGKVSDKTDTIACSKNRNAREGGEGRETDMSHGGPGGVKMWSEAFNGREGESLAEGGKGQEKGQGEDERSGQI